MKDSGIEWTHHTFNPWLGCAHVSPGCARCYAETLMDKRYGRVKWGAGQARVRTSPDYWRQPLKWNRAAAAAGERHRVFCASLADVFEPAIPDQWRNDLFDLIHETPGLDWLLLTKRPENIAIGFHRWAAQRATPSAPDAGLANVWLGTSVENQAYANLRIPHLAPFTAVRRFLSAEPLLGPLDLRPWLGRDIDWVIVGGESGPGARYVNPRWAREIRDQCVATRIPFFFKQWGGTNKKTDGRELDDRTWDEIPTTKGAQS